MKQPERITDTHIYFWGSFYSQWAKYYITDSSLQQKFSSCEQYMMYHKAILFNDDESAKKILETNNVKKQKELGRKVKGFNQKEWDKHKFNIIVKGNFLKFSQNEDIQKKLLNSGEKILVEASPYDKIYGVGLKWDNDLILDEKNWKGENLLGKALMKVRDILRTQNGDKLNKFFSKHAINKEEYTKEIIKLAEDKFGDSKSAPKDLKEKAKKTLLSNSKKSTKKGDPLKPLDKARKRIDNLPDNWFNGKPLLMEIQGSILEAKEDIIAQGCNCAGASGAGIAKYIAKEYPESDKKYKELCSKKQFNLGTVMFHEEKDKIQAFCGTQQYYGRYLKMDKDSIEKRYQAIENCLLKIYEMAKKENLSVALPRIGCGRARADWSRVKEIIEKIFHDHPVTIYWIPDRYSKK